MPYVVEYLLLVFPGTERIQAANLTLPIISETEAKRADTGDPVTVDLPAQLKRYGACSNSPRQA